MANVKNITELPVAESAEGLNLIVNDGGAAKQIAASAVGGTQADWNQNDPTKPDYVKNRPFYTETAEIKVDVVEGLEEVHLPNFPDFAVGDTVTVNVNDVRYTLVAFECGGCATIGDDPDDLYDGGGSYGWYIMCYCSDGTICACSNGCTVSYMGEVIHKIDAKYVHGVIVDMNTLPFGDMWFDSGTETEAMSKEQWEELVNLAINRRANTIVTGYDPGIYGIGFIFGDTIFDGTVTMHRTEIMFNDGELRVYGHHKELVYDEGQQLCTCTCSGGYVRGTLVEST